MSAYDSVLTIGVLLGLFLLAYCRFTNKTLLDVFREVREMFADETEEVISPY